MLEEDTERTIELQVRYDMEEGQRHSHTFHWLFLLLYPLVFPLIQGDQR